MKKFTLAFFALTAFAFADPVLVNGSFEAVAITTGTGYAYQTIPAAAPQQDFNGAPGFGWTLAEGSGLSSNGSAFNPPTITAGTQALFLQGSTSASQSLNFAAGSYVLNFTIGGRQNDGCCDGNQWVRVTVSNGSGTVLSQLVSTASYSPFAPQSLAFSTGAGAYTVTFAGLAERDSTAFVDAVSIASVPEPAATASLVAGLGLAGLVARRRKHSA